MKKNVNHNFWNHKMTALKLPLSAIDRPKPKYLKRAMIQDNENKQISTIKKLQ